MHLIMYASTQDNSKKMVTYFDWENGADGVLLFDVQRNENLGLLLVVVSSTTARLVCILGKYKSGNYV